MNNVVRSTLSKLLIGLAITLKKKERKKRRMAGREKQQINHAVSDEDEDVD